MTSFCGTISLDEKVQSKVHQASCARRNSPDLKVVPTESHVERTSELSVTVHSNGNPNEYLLREKQSLVMQKCKIVEGLFFPLNWRAQSKVKKLELQIDYIDELLYGEEILSRENEIRSLIISTERTRQKYDEIKMLIAARHGEET